MTNNRGQQIIALEEHNSDEGLLELPVEQGGRSHSGQMLDRLMDFNEHRIKEMDESGIDIQLSPAARKHFPWGIECKNQEALSIWKCL